MPVYLCQPGSGETEPWRHGIQVFAAPFPMDDSSAVKKVITGSGGTTRDGNFTAVIAGGGGCVGPPTCRIDATTTLKDGTTADDDDNGVVAVGSDSNNNNNSNNSNSARTRGVTRDGWSVAGTTAAAIPATPIRRIRHAEVVLADDICIAYDRYWLRLCWPGSKRGFAGYVAMGLVSETSSAKAAENASAISRSFRRLESFEGRGGTEDTDTDDPAREEEPLETGSMPPSEPFLSSKSVMCIRTGLAFPTSSAMTLLPAYDDGFPPPPASLVPFTTEPVFCRICREGLHEDADGMQPTASADNDEGDGGGEDPSSGTATMNATGEDGEEDEPLSANPTDTLRGFDKGPVQPHPAYATNSNAVRNPLLAPCECSGSMAFVHYLCLEQWRCRSQHPDARDGLNCETCGATYSLPPPSDRIAPVQEQEDWIDAMPPHVMQALRQPHIWWQIGAGIVRRRWLRPIAPVLMSPVVALYCRARRLLKKRGVARRRWACSLCRRRARWKCVRCLRSYYCSRQCQNVSWHIVHKHVCYKPVRYWWSVVVYGALTLAVFPGILRDPFMYDIGLCLIPVSFIMTGILGGGIATFFKKSFGIDLRGRVLELVVLLLTLWLSVVSWGLVKGFFGNSSSCHGVFGSYAISKDQLPASYIFKFLHTFLLQPFQACYLMWDRLALDTASWLRVFLCTSNDTPGCFEHLPHANANFFLQENNGERCASDLLMVISLYIASGIAYVGTTYWKHVDRARRRHHGRGRPRPHQD